MSRALQFNVDPSDEDTSMMVMAGSPIKQPMQRGYGLGLPQDDDDINTYRHKLYNLGRGGDPISVGDASAYVRRAKPKALGLGEFGEYKLQPPELREPISVRGGGKGYSWYDSAEYNSVQDALVGIAGSKIARDIKRTENFMSPEMLQQLNNKRVANGMAPYYGEWVDADGDDIDEFVVRTKQAGPIIGVNGYTTQKSDWPIKSAWYKKYPSKEDRKNNSFNSFVTDYYTNDPHVKYATDESGFPTEAYMHRRKQLQAGSKYKLHLPAPSAYNLFTQRLVSGVYKFIVDEIVKANQGKVTADTISKVMTATMGQGWMMAAAAELWKILVKDPAKQHLHDLGKLDSILEAARNTKAYTKAADKEEFLDKYVMNKKVTKNLVHDIVAPMLNLRSPSSQQITRAIGDHMVKLIGDACSSNDIQIVPPAEYSGEYSSLLE